MELLKVLRGNFKANAADSCQTLTPDGQTYFSQVLAQYQLLPQTAAPGPAEAGLRKFADSIAARKPEDRTWADLFALEICVVKLLPELDLRRGAWAIRSKYRDLAGPNEFDSYQASNPPDPKTGNVEELRADTLKILGEFHWIYAFTPIRERMRDSLARAVFYFTLLLSGFALVIAAVGYYPQLKSGNLGVASVPVLPIIIVMGMVGGYVSLKQRIQSVPSTGDPIVNIAELSNSRFSLYLAPISGAVFAVLLYIIFIGGLLTGPLFPTISSPEGSCEDSMSTGARSVTVAPPTSDAIAPTADVGGASASSLVPGSAGKKCIQTVAFTGFVRQTGPASGSAFALLLVWAFIAGFAERFVPDTIDRLVSQAAQK